MKILGLFFQCVAEILLCNFGVFLWFLTLADDWWNTLPRGRHMLINVKEQDVATSCHHKPR
jgi:hypothetical protein